MGALSSILQDAVSDDEYSDSEYDSGSDDDKEYEGYEGYGELNDLDNELNQERINSCFCRFFK